MAFHQEPPILLRMTFTPRYNKKYSTAVMTESERKWSNNSQDPGSGDKLIIVLCSE